MTREANCWSTSALAEASCSARDFVAINRDLFKALNERQQTLVRSDSPMADWHAWNFVPIIRLKYQQIDELIGELGERAIWNATSVSGFNVCGSLPIELFLPHFAPALTKRSSTSTGSWTESAELR